MSNIDRKAGFNPVKNLDGSPWNGKVRTYYVPDSNADALFKGDAVALAAGADDTGKYPVIKKAAADAAVVGVVIGFGSEPQVMINPDNPTLTYCPAGAEMYAIVVDDPNVIFETQASAAFDADMVGKTAKISLEDGDEVSGRSGMSVDVATVDVTAQPCKILRIVNREDNELGEFCKLEIMFGMHRMRVDTGV